MDWCDDSDPTVAYENFTDIVAEKVSLLSVFDKLGIEYSECRSGDFTHRAKCPLPQHSGGHERTASFYISEKNNSFYCFGCSSGSNCIGFVELYLGKPYMSAARWLAEQFGITGEGNEGILIKKRDPSELPITYIHKAGVAIRNFLVAIKETPEYNKWCVWAEKRFDTLDKFIDTLEDDDWKKAKEYYDKLMIYLAKQGAK